MRSRHFCEFRIENIHGATKTNSHYHNSAGKSGPEVNIPEQVSDSFPGSVSFSARHQQCFIDEIVFEEGAKIEVMVLLYLRKGKMFLRENV
jgi:hypothetical protein